jgi:hypothetical protein
MLQTIKRPGSVVATAGGSPPPNGSAEFGRLLAKIVKQMSAQMAAALKSGALSNGEAGAEIRFMASFYPELERIMLQSGYTELVSKLKDDYPDLINDLKAVHKYSEVPLAFVKSDATVLTSLSTIFNKRFENIGKEAVQAVYDRLTQSVLAGASESKMIALIRDTLDSKLQRYATTYYNTARKDFMQQAELLSAENNRIGDEELYFEYVGPLDNVTRDACISLLENPYYTEAEMLEAEAATADERAYNCRHWFQQISRSTFEDKPMDFDADEQARRDALYDKL